MSRVKALMRLFRYGFPGRRPAAPIILMFHITTRCDMHCRHCGDDVWGDPADDLSFREIEKLSQGSGDLVDLALGGGEPFLRADLTDICELFVRRNRVQNLGIPSNGFATERICSGVQQILECTPGTKLNIMLSLDGFEPTHDEIRRPGSFKQVMATASRLSAMRDHYKNLNLCFNATINNVNWQELPALAGFVRETFQADLDFNVLTGNPRDATFTAPAQPELEKTIDGMFAVRQASPLAADWLRVCRDIILRTNVEGRQIIPCRAGSLIAMIDANGDVRACPYLPAIGKLRQKSFQEIWHGEVAMHQHRSISRSGCTCNSDCFVTSSLNNYWKLPFLMLEQRVRRSVAGGQ